MGALLRLFFVIFKLFYGIILKNKRKYYANNHTFNDRRRSMEIHS